MPSELRRCRDHRNTAQLFEISYVGKTLKYRWRNSGKLGNASGSRTRLLIACEERLGGFRSALSLAW